MGFRIWISEVNSSNNSTVKETSNPCNLLDFWDCLDVENYQTLIQTENKENEIGPNIEPCGTPQDVSEKSLLKLI